MDYSKIVDNLLLSNNLRKADASRVFRALFGGKLTDIEAKSFLALLHRKGESALSLFMLVKTARNMNKGIRLQASIKNVSDTCGTGGDKKGTFNISTVSAFVAAGAGAKIAKHGNRSITSSCGSSDLIEAFGIPLDMPTKKVIRSIQKIGIGYFHAPLYNQSFARVQRIRKELAAQKIKTIFNMAGPLLNPLGVKRQVIGVYHPSLIPTMLETLKKLNCAHAIVLSGRNGTDELTTDQITYAGELKNGKIRYFTIKPSQLALRKSNPQTIKGGSVRKNHHMALRLLKGVDKSARRDVISANAGLILYVSRKAKNLKEGIRKAKISIDSGKAFSTLNQLRSMSHAA